MTELELYRLIEDACDKIDYRRGDEFTSLAWASLATQVEKSLKERGILVNALIPTKTADNFARQVWLSIPRKVLVCDLDGTLWAGVIGEDGYGIDPNRELLDDIACLKKQGVLLAICSQNDEHFIKTQVLPDLIAPLGIDDFVSIQISYGKHKHDMLMAIGDELNLPVSAFVFVDDDIVQRNLVKTMLPEVAVIAPAEFLDLRCFDQDEKTPEDYKRTDMYQAEKERRALMSIENWLSLLQMKVNIQKIDWDSRTELLRAWQLVNKVNQMNVRPRRVEEWDWAQQFSSIDFHCWVFRAEDRFGDYGIVGVVSIRDKSLVQVVDFVLSCRAIGRGIEEIMFIEVLKWASDHNRDAVSFMCTRTELNIPAQVFADKIAEHGYPALPDWIEVIYD